MKLHVLGTGCPKCSKLYQNVRAAAEELGLDAEVIKVTDVNEIAAMGAVITPALAVEGEIRAAGKVPSIEKIKEMLTR